MKIDIKRNRLVHVLREIEKEGKDKEEWKSKENHKIRELKGKAIRCVWMKNEVV